MQAGRARWPASLAPTYLPGFPLSGTRLVNGGVWANNPAMVAVVEAAGACAVQPEALRVFSLGTTSEVRHRGRGLDRGTAVNLGSANPTGECRITHFDVCPAKRAPDDGSLLQAIWRQRR